MSRKNLAWCGCAFLLGLTLFVYGALTGLDSALGFAVGVPGGIMAAFSLLWVKDHLPFGSQVLFGLGLLLACGGATLACFGWEDYKWFASSAAQPQELRYEELVQRGYGDNRHVRLRDFTYGARYPVADDARNNPDRPNDRKVVWVPLLPKGTRVTARGTGPQTVQVFIKDWDIYPCPPPDLTERPLGNPGEGGSERTVRLKEEMKGVEGMVLNGFKSLTTEEQNRIRQLYPNTDFAKVILIEKNGRPPEAGKVYGLLAGGAALFVPGAVLILVVVVRAWRSAAGLLTLAT